MAAIDRNSEQNLVPDAQKVIAMTLYGSEPKYTYGAIRNAQLMPVLFPDWTLQIYIDAKSNRVSPPVYSPTPMNASNSSLSNATSKSDTTTISTESSLRSKYTVPALVLNKLRTLGAHVVHVEGSIVDMLHPNMWRYLVANQPNVTVALVRDVLGRITKRDHRLVSDWLNGNVTLMSTREVATLPVLPTGGNVAFRTSSLHLNHSVKDIAAEFVEQKKTLLTEAYFLKEVVEPEIMDNWLAYDSIACDKLDRTQPFTVQSGKKLNFFGQLYNIYDEGQLKFGGKPECFVKDAPIL